VEHYILGSLESSAYPYIDISFDENVKKMGKGSELEKNLHRIVIDVTQKRGNEILRDLNRMNVNSAILFPGLEGFAKSLETQLAVMSRFM
jgi:hypothetical protein